MTSTPSVNEPRRPELDGGESGLGSLLVPDRLATWAWVLGYTAVLTTLSILRYQLWLAHGFDLGFYEQALWLLLQHHGLAAPSTYTGRPPLAYEDSYILVLIAPLYALGGVGLLLAIQAFALGLGYFFIRRIARCLGLADRPAHFIGVMYLVYPTVVALNLFDFHPEVFAIALFLAIVWAILESKWWAYYALAALVMSVTVAAALPLTGIGIVLALRRQWPQAFYTVAVVVGVGWFLDARVVAQQLNAPNPWTAYYGVLGPTLGVAVQHLIRRPAALVAWTTELRAWEYLAWIVGPLAVCVVAARKGVGNAWWIPAGVVAAANLINGGPTFTSPFSPSTAVVVPFVFAATIAAVRTGIDARYPRWLLMFVPALALGALLVHEYQIDWRAMPRYQGAVQVAVQAVPPKVAVAAPDYVIPHLANRAYEWDFTGPRTEWPAGTYVIVDATVDHALLQSLRRPGLASQITSSGPLSVWRLNQPLSEATIG